VNSLIEQVDEEPPPGPPVVLDLVARKCAAGDCPTVYRTNRGTLVVQGYAFEPGNAGVAVPDGEGMVEIPLDLLWEFARIVA